MILITEDNNWWNMRIFCTIIYNSTHLKISLQSNTLKCNITEDELLNSDEDETDTYQCTSRKRTVADEEVQISDERYI